MSEINENESGGKLSKALKKELRNITLYVAIGLVIMFGLFFLFMCIFPEIKESEDFEYYKILLGGVGGGAVAVFNFFLMGLTVQKVAADTNPERARNSSHDKSCEMPFPRDVVLDGVFRINAPNQTAIKKHH